MNNSEKISDKILEKIYGSKICTHEFVFQDRESEAIFGDKEEHPLTFDLYDGFGYCYNDGEEYFITYAKSEFLKLCPEMANEIREFCGLNATDEINVVDVVYSYGRLTKI